MTASRLGSRVGRLGAVLRGCSGNKVLVKRNPLATSLVSVASGSFGAMDTMSVKVVFIVVVLLFGSVSLPVVLMNIVRFTVFIGVNVPCCVKAGLPFITSVMVKAVRLKSAMSCTVLVAAHCGERHGRNTGGCSSVAATRHMSTRSVVMDTLDFFTTAVNMKLCSGVSVVDSLYVLVTEKTLVDVMIMVFMLPSVFVMFSGMVIGADGKFLPPGR